jgi:hypothetical protein
MKLCACCRSFIATRYGHDEKGALVPYCTACFQQLCPVLAKEEQERRKETARAAIEVEQLDAMWKLDGSWIKEGAHR